MPEKSCPICGQAFHYKASQPHRECCSVTCAGRARMQRRINAGLWVQPIKPRRGETNPCAVCGTPVYRNRTQAAVGQGIYCSRACQRLGRTKTPVLKTCPVCGQGLRLKPSQAPRQYCSRACQTLARIKRPLDEQYNGMPVKLDHAGYRMLWEPSHPNRTFKGWQYEHRLVAERILGHPLASEDAVHHLNGIKDDNRPENLVVMDGKEHALLSGQEYREQLERERAELEEYRRRFGPLRKE